MELNQVIYLRNMPVATALDGSELIHFSQNNTDYALPLSVLQTAFNNALHPVGALVNFGVANRNPNVTFPGQEWIRFQAGRSFRGATSDDEIGIQIGSDQVVLAVSHLAAHGHAAAGLGTSYAGDHNHTATTSTSGGHTHTGTAASAGAHDHQADMRSPGRQWGTMTKGSNNSTDNKLAYTNDSGNHTHPVGMNGAGGHSHTFVANAAGNHSHTITGTTASAGSNAPITLTEQMQTITCWLRTK